MLQRTLALRLFLNILLVLRVCPSMTLGRFRCRAGPTPLSMGVILTRIKEGKALERLIRELKIEDIDLIISYFLQADKALLNRMGVDPEKLPSPDDWRKKIIDDLTRPLYQKQFYYLIWELDSCPIGHSNINKIVYGDNAYMHLHLWKSGNRKRGNGAYFLRECINTFFNKFDLQNLYCEPYTLNPAPNKTLAKVGFELVKQYATIPGWINFHQKVNQWVLSREKWITIACSGR
jgi:RimJ/RimL family protein N-acetyltransferase